MSNRFFINNYNIKIECNNKKYLNFLLKQLCLLVKHFKYFSYYRLPKKLKRFTVIKSPHVFKKSRTQFELIFYKLGLNFFDQKNLKLLIKYFNFYNKRIFSYLLCKIILKKKFIYIKKK